uniref:HTH CENPB-type domain-containing protein n=1 Tax=Chelonoidis abingdonii TaxID=106734 RepID=A0A8C0HJH9_CHEAB
RAWQLCCMQKSGTSAHTFHNVEPYGQRSPEPRCLDSASQVLRKPPPPTSLYVCVLRDLISASGTWHELHLFQYCPIFKMNNGEIKRERSAYHTAFKLKVVEYAEANNNCAAACEFCIKEKQVREWRKNKTTLKDMPRSKKKCPTRCASFPELEKDLNNWVVKCRQNGYIVNRTRICALQMSKDNKYKSVKPSVFVESAGWCTHFINRHDFCLRQRTKIVQKLLRDLVIKIESFQRFIIKYRKEYAFELSQIGNMDKTLMTFDLLSNRMVTGVGEKTVLIKTTGHEKIHFMLVLSCLANGSKLHPVVIFKRETLPKNMKFPAGVIVHAREKGWMDESGTIEWLEKVWNKIPGALFKKPAMLVCDMFRAYKMDDVKNVAKNMKTTLAVIPEGLTSVPQPLADCLNKPFEDRLRKMWSEWICSGMAKLIKGGNLMKPEINLVAQWIKDAWVSIPSERVEKSFRKCCISNALDRSEDDAIFNDDTTEADDEKESESGDDTADIYVDNAVAAVTEAEFNELFGESETDSDFEGF